MENIRKLGENDQDFGKSFPKIELHRHLEGSGRFETLIDITQKQNRKLESIPRENETFWKQYFFEDEPMKDLTACMEKFWAHQSCFSNVEHIERISFEMVEDCWRDGIILIEIRYSPQYILHNHPHLNFDDIHESILRGIQRGMKEYPIQVGLIGIIDRNLSLDVASNVVDFIVKKKKDFVGVDLANDELLYDPHPFQPLFEKLKKEGLRITIHAGESLMNSRRYAENVLYAIDSLGAERIGHGIAIVDHPDIVEYVKEKGIVLEISVSSNYLSGIVPSVAEHPVKKLMDMGVKICLSSDDPGLFNTTLSLEYRQLYKEMGFTKEDFIKMNEIALEASFIPKEKIQHIQLK